MSGMTGQNNNRVKRVLTPELLQIVDERVNGATLQEISTPRGIHESTVSKRLSRPEVKAHLERLQSSLIEKTLHLAVDNIHQVVDGYRTAPDESKKCEHGFKASIRLMESAGLLTSQQQSIYIQQIYNDNRTEIPDIVKELFQRVTSNDGSNQSYLDAEVVEEK